MVIESMDAGECGLLVWPRENVPDALMPVIRNVRFDSHKATPRVLVVTSTHNGVLVAVGSANAPAAVKARTIANTNFTAANIAHAPKASSADAGDSVDVHGAEVDEARVLEAVVAVEGDAADVAALPTGRALVAVAAGVQSGPDESSDPALALDPDPDRFSVHDCVQNMASAPE